MFIYTVYICFKRNGDKKIRDTDIYSAILIDFNKVRFIHIYENTFYKHKSVTGRIQLCLTMSICFLISTDTNIA